MDTDEILCQFTQSFKIFRHNLRGLKARVLLNYVQRSDGMIDALSCDDKHSRYRPNKVIHTCVKISQVNIVNYMRYDL